ncbi:MAG: hypothetical protein AAGA48_14085 [Myxococcota bacterium]
MRWWFAVVLGCSSPAPAPVEAPVEPNAPVMAKGRKATPSAGRRGPDPLTVTPYGTDPAHPCPDCDRCKVSKVTASATRDAHVTETYEAAHLIDGNPSSAWCAETDDEGRLPSLTFSVPAGCRMQGMRILGGHFGDRTRLQKNGRVSELSLTAGRLRGAAEVEDPVGMKPNLRQMIDKPAVLYAGWSAYAIDTLTVQLRHIHAGSVHPGVCLSELSPILSGTPLAP